MCEWISIPVNDNGPTITLYSTRKCDGGPIYHLSVGILLIIKTVFSEKKKIVIIFTFSQNTFPHQSL